MLAVSDKTVRWLQESLLLILLTIKPSESIATCEYSIEQEWDNGFLGKIAIPIAERYNFGWILHVRFETPIREFDIFEAELYRASPNQKEYICTNKDYNYVVYFYKNKVMNMFLQGSQYPTDDRSVYIGPPDAEVLFVPRLHDRETISEALFRAENAPVTKSVPANSISSTQSTTTVLMTSTQSTSATTKLPWFGWLTEAPNVLTSTLSTKPTSSTPKTKKVPVSKKFRHNLREVIMKSLLFYEAQRSGKLPISNRVRWRSHSALRDGSDAGVDLTGGYYIDGGHVKYGFPMAATVTLLSWGAIEFKRGYVAAKELGNLLAAIKWGTDYLLKCHADPYTFYGQISNGDIDSATWVRPEDMGGVRPSYKITRNRPGSDLAGETSAAFAAASIVLRETFPQYSEKLRNHSEQLFRFADRYRGRYDKSIPGASKYGSSGYFDELAWAAAWLYGITKDETYLNYATSRLSQSTDESVVDRFDWNDKRVAVIALMAQMTNRTEYRLALLDFCDSMLLGGGSNYTMKGLLYLDGEDSTALASNSAFICLIAASVGIRTDVYVAFAQRQLNYILGDSGQSFVVGYGNTSPKRPYHMGSSCPDRPQRCSWANRDADVSNPHALDGALIGGPDKWDNYVDDRNSLSNRVSIYNNAGFQSVAAAILQIQVSSETFSDPEPGELMPLLEHRFDNYHDYSQVLRFSNMFFEAQRSGILPSNNRIKWRQTSCTDDKGTEGQNLSGGYFDGGDYIKFNFPMAFTTTVLAWGMLTYPQAYDSAGEKLQMRDTLRWATDYFIKCHTGKYEVYGQVGSSALEHSHWSRPEDIKYIRPAFKITKKTPGSEVAAEMAAAMAATAAVFNKSNPIYSNLLIKHAKELYQFADKYREVYHRSIPDAAQHYPSFNGYKDELVWASIWLYVATGDSAYLTEARSKHGRFGLGRLAVTDFYWDDKTAGANVLLARFTKSNLYISETEKFCDHMITRGKYTPKGLLYRRPWGPLQYSSGAALICLMAADLGIKPYEYREFAKEQIHYVLGDSGLGSYVVGYGPTPPKRPHHRTSSCPSHPDPCNFTALYSEESNPHVLYGAVVAGPDDKDQFTDDRTNSRSNKVSLTYNAAFQSAVASLKYLQMYPPPPPPTTTPQTEPVTEAELTTQPTTTAVSTAPIATTIVTTYNSTLQPTATTPGPPSENATSQQTNASATTVQNGPPWHNGTAIPATGVSTATQGFSVNASNTIATPNSRPVTAGYQNVTSPLPVTVGKMAPPNVTEAFPVEKAGTSPASVDGVSHNRDKRYCGRQRALQLFDECVIARTDYHEHGDSKIYRCRYHSFKACVNVQTDTCPDGVWEYWPYWNHNANDSVFFDEDETVCKDQLTIDIENCELRGLTWAFNDCHKLIQNWDASSEKCSWAEFVKCVTKHVNHCHRTWKIWQLWNIGLPPEQQFSEDKMSCESSTTSVHTFSTAVVISFALFSYSIFPVEV